MSHSTKILRLSMHLVILGCVVVIALALNTVSSYARDSANQGLAAGHRGDRPMSGITESMVFLPLISGLKQPPTRRVNIPYFNNRPENHMSGLTLFWFGRISTTDNYADVRTGYNDSELYLHVSVVDRRLWYNAANPPEGALTAWDAVSLFLASADNPGSTPGSAAYRFDAQLSAWEPRANYSASYRGDGAGWVRATIPFTTVSGWRGPAVNDNIDDQGWTMDFHIPFSALGLAGPPAQGTAPWRLALAVYDRDDAAGTPLPIQVWPEAMNVNSPASWGQLQFGLATYLPPPTVSGQSSTIRQGFGISVPDAAVGGRFTCGDWLEIWTQWGNANYAGEGSFNIQNETDISDWPCFSKYYVTFPLATVPPGKVIISATLSLHQFGQAGAPGAAHYSIIQVSTVAEDWNESTLTWNNAPLALENVGWATVDPALPQPCIWPCVLRTWNVSYAVAQAYASQQPLRLALYSGDPFYDSGKYFVSSDTGDWNAVARPTLDVLWGDPR